MFIIAWLELRQRGEHRLVIRLVPRVLEHLPVPDDAVLVEDEHRPFRDPLEANHVLVEHAIVADGLLVEVAQQRKRESLLVVKRLEREEGVHADAEHLRVRSVGPVELVYPIPERAQLLLTHRAERRREEREHDRPPAQRAERHRLALLIREGKVRRLRSHIYSHRSSSRYQSCNVVANGLFDVPFSFGTTGWTRP